MTWCVEWNISPQSDMDDFHIDTVEMIAAKNRRMLEKGKVPTYVVIGHAPSLSEARQFANEYLAQNPRV
jgi:hypothetical protein